MPAVPLTYPEPHVRTVLHYVRDYVERGIVGVRGTP